METYLLKVKDEWTVLINEASPEVRLITTELATRHAAELSKAFYRAMLADPHTSEFLTNEQVERQLQDALHSWIIDILSCKTEDIDHLIQAQQRAADVHARIGIPVDLVEMGFRVLKNYFFPPLPLLSIQLK